MKKVIILIIIIVVAGFFLFTDDSEQAEVNEPAGDLSDESAVSGDGVEITPISHATLVLNWDEQVIYIDPVGGAEAFAGQPTPDLILITDIHGDHMDADTLEAVVSEGVSVVVPQAVADELPEDFSNSLSILSNGDIVNINGFSIEAIPMYNLPEAEDSFHVKGRGNGYVIERGEERVYIAGDTGPIPEMRALKNIDIAFVPMNLPFTMTVEDAAGAVLDFAPTQVYPYHYRGREGLSDVGKFKELINEGNPEIEVVQLDWYE